MTPSAQPITCTAVPCKEHPHCWNIQHSDGHLLTCAEVIPSLYRVTPTGTYRPHMRTIALPHATYHTRGKLTAERKALRTALRLNAKERT